MKSIIKGIDDILRSHKPFTSNSERIKLAYESSWKALSDVTNGDHLNNLGEATSHYALKHIQHKMQSHPVGSWILKEKPRIRDDVVDYEALRKLPKNTFGAKYL